ncbi:MULTISPECIES: SDR family oxidoreductase [unclassified Haladaptatus]|uniref:SDR family oxidoreductase n=1 Tax=unclassified Haladaptatus TaxID=2622732 RepID=UPI00209C2120|nr:MULTISPECIES: SDR family oxidoreductase [unclassified Haladaptatus]MCO8245403.1 SDR family oxidoreductase [Haladaptatus sp. AB643]MCO8256865.1 SDR family oxidoreductase [Haladaptatus sp. AB618]
MTTITDDLEGKTALVTGASSGIGESTAETLSEAGASVALAARREDELAQLANRIESKDGEALVIPTDVTNEEDIREMIDRTQEEFGTLDILINNAGVMLLEQVEDANTDNFRQMVEVNLLGMMNTAHAALPIMQDQGEGHIVNISSVAGRKAYAGSSGYNATKFGVNGFSEALREEVTGENDIRVTLIEPGYVDTELAEHIPDDEQKSQAEQMLESMDALSPDDIARSIAYAVGQPPHVDVNEILIRPTDQEL